MGGAKPCRKYGSTMVQLNEKTGWVGQKFLGPNFSLHTGLVCTSFGGFPLIGWTSQFCSLPWVPLVPFLEFTIVPFLFFWTHFGTHLPFRTKYKKNCQSLKVHLMPLSSTLSQTIFRLSRVLFVASNIATWEDVIWGWNILTNQVSIGSFSVRQNYWSLFVWPWNFFVQSP